MVSRMMIAIVSKPRRAVCSSAAEPLSMLTWRILQQARKAASESCRLGAKYVRGSLRHPWPASPNVRVSILAGLLFFPSNYRSSGFSRRAMGTIWARPDLFQIGT